MSFATKNIPNAPETFLTPKGGDLKVENKVQIETGDVVTYVDPTGLEHKALVTAAWSFTTVNVVYVVKDKKKCDC